FTLVLGPKVAIHARDEDAWPHGRVGLQAAFGELVVLQERGPRHEKRGDGDDGRVVRGREDRNVERRGDVDVEGRPEPLRLEELVAAARSDRDVLQHVEVPSRRNPTGEGGLDGRALRDRHAEVEIDEPFRYT